jgi:hypothetical protein
LSICKNPGQGSRATNVIQPQDRKSGAAGRLIGYARVSIEEQGTARSVSHLLVVIEQLEGNGAHFRSLRDPIDTTTPQGMFSLQVLGAVAQLERALIAERTKAGLRARDPDAIRKVRSSRDAAYLDDALAQLDSWLPTVRRMRPGQPWGDAVRVLNRGQAAHWTVERLRRTVRRLAAEGIIEANLLERARPQRGDDRLLRLVTLQQIAAQREAMCERTPRGGTRWHPSSVKHLLDQAGRLGLTGTMTR